MCSAAVVSLMASKEDIQGIPSQLSWIKDGELLTDELKAVVSGLAKKLASSSRHSGDVQREGAKSFLSLINSVWSLETNVARDSADLIAMEIRYT